MTESTNEIISQYLNDFKKHLLMQLKDFHPSSVVADVENMQRFICNYTDLKIAEPLKLKKDTKKPRKKNINLQKCWAKLESGCQCKRKQQTHTSYCKEHINNTSFGIITDNADQTEINNNEKKSTMNLFIQNINGIHYFVDEKQNVYKSESILAQNSQPKIIGTTADDMFS